MSRERLSDFKGTGYADEDLAPCKMMGIEFQGMVLMAEDGDGKLNSVQISDIVSSGSVVS